MPPAPPPALRRCLRPRVAGSGAPCLARLVQAESSLVCCVGQRGVLVFCLHSYSVVSGIVMRCFLSRQRGKATRGPQQRIFVPAAGRPRAVRRPHLRAIRARNAQSCNLITDSLSSQHSFTATRRVARPGPQQGAVVLPAAHRPHLRAVCAHLRALRAQARRQSDQHPHAVSKCSKFGQVHPASAARYPKLPGRPGNFRVIPQNYPGRPGNFRGIPKKYPGRPGNFWVIPKKYPGGRVISG